MIQYSLLSALYHAELCRPDNINIGAVLLYKNKKYYLDGMEKTIQIAKNRNFIGLCFVNLVDSLPLMGRVLQ